tara:strand:- start:1749 stop:2813 length:1065 start_codon:yes stop_codon:yes gene_type:complete
MVCLCLDYNEIENPIYKENRATNGLWNNILLNYNVNYDYLSYNQQIDAKLINSYISKSWNWKIISKRVSCNSLKAYPNWPYDFNILSLNRNIDIETIIEMNKIVNWNRINLSSHINIFDNRCNQIFESKFYDDECDWHILSKNPFLTWHYIKSNSDRPWDWFILSKTILTPDIYRNEPNYPWEKKGIVQNTNFSLETCIEISRLESLFFWFSKNSNLDFKFIYENSNDKWNWYELSSMKNEIPLWYIKKNITFGWDWYALAKRYEWRKLIKSSILTWSPRGLYENKYLCFEDLKSDFKYSMTKWMWKVIHYDIDSLSRNWMAAYRIQIKFWKQIAYNPIYKFCQKRLFSIYNMM